MGISKNELFSDRHNQIAAVSKALSHPARIAIIEYLLQLKTCVNAELIDEIGLAQATISQHLNELKEIGIIQGSIQGKRISYCIHPERWDEIKTMYTELFQQGPSTSSCSPCEDEK